MTSTEDLLRDGLARLAPRAPADQAAYAGLGRAVTRRRRRRAAARVAAVTAVALMALGAAGLATRPTGDPGYSTDVSTATSTTTTAPDAGAGPRTAFGPASFVLPDGWSVVSQDEGRMCVGPEGTAEIPVDCAGVAFSLPPLVGHEGEAYVDHGPWQFQTSTDPLTCPDGPEAVGEAFDAVVPGVDGMDPVVRGTRQVGGRPAVYDEWVAGCDLSGFSFHPRAWHLSDPEMLIMDLLARPETEALLDSIVFDGGAPT